jgi:hypothetical protein
MKMNKEEYIDKMARDLEEWSLDIDEYKLRASRGPIDVQADYEQSIRNLQEKRDLLASKLRELRGFSGDAWTTLERGVETAKHELRDAFEAARYAVKKTA